MSRKRPNPEDWEYPNLNTQGFRHAGDYTQLGFSSSDEEEKLEYGDTIHLRLNEGRKRFKTTHRR
jgi:hypothetical protein